MSESTAAGLVGSSRDYECEGRSRACPERVLAHLRLLDGDDGGFAVDRLTHSLQTATRAERAGRPDEYVLCALIHDIGDTLGPYGHSELAAAILKPYVHPGAALDGGKARRIPGVLLLPPPRAWTATFATSTPVIRCMT